MTLETTAVIGAGTMGHALALVHALGGCRVRLHDSNPEVLAAAPDLIRAALATLEEAGSLSGAEGRAALDRISLSDTLAEAVAGADLVVEAVVEKPEVKRAVFARIDAHAPPTAILASNTSYLDVFPLIPVARQARAAVAHWYTPPYIVDLVDLAPGPQTAPEVIEDLRALYTGFGKMPVVFDRLVPGYIANRLQAALNLESLRMIDEGWVSAQDIDRSIQHGLVHRLAVLGHMKKMDYTGLEMVRNGIAGRRYQPPGNNGETPVLDRLIAAGRSGVRAGAGFYDYGDTPAEELFRDRDLQLLRLKAHLQNLKGESK
ncbi:3-hydroxyacyl-CoA dehydrogenase family protein [Antarcticimicrobium luteum]|uniref:3-hydroxyacyl-CoA dehydrogenase family protein n=1 Tax=Antarcticimicrobium luteum TaxID=2547397 RepID=A0A4R5VFR1_9RHOB|nr:3-hydroxyacyl-CoA dehydrogenase family protein [Antarcticimicrobium luteum]TDK50686.1 3-hydroxyacyl-CoA dehydrogenase family protein [Antarcticimicrobium luteum]